MHATGSCYICGRNIGRAGRDADLTNGTYAECCMCHRCRAALRPSTFLEQYSDAAMWWPNEDWSRAVGRERETVEHQTRGREK